MKSPLLLIDSSLRFVRHSIYASCFDSNPVFLLW